MSVKMETVPTPAAKIYPDSPLGSTEAGIPTGRDVPWEPLVDYRRAGVSETTIHGAIAWAHGGQIIHQRARPVENDVTDHARSECSAIAR